MQDSSSRESPDYGQVETTGDWQKYARPVDLLDARPVHSRPSEGPVSRASENGQGN